MLVAYTVSVQLIRALNGPLASIARADKALADQIRRAASSVTLNIAEGERRVGRDQAHLFRIAAGSCAEVRAALDVALGWSYVEEDALGVALALIDRELGLLWGLTHRTG